MHVLQILLHVMHVLLLLHVIYLPLLLHVYVLPLLYVIYIAKILKPMTHSYSVNNIAYSLLYYVLNNKVLV